DPVGSRPARPRSGERRCGGGVARTRARAGVRGVRTPRRRAPGGSRARCEGVLDRVDRGRGGGGVIDRARASAVAPREMPFHNPISEDTIDALVGLLPLGSGDSTLDVGCGRGELLIRIAEATGAHGFGLDSSEALIAHARHEATARAPATEMIFETRDAGTLVAPAGSFALAACVGSSHALGGLAAALRRLTQPVRPRRPPLPRPGYPVPPPPPPPP